MEHRIDELLDVFEKIQEAMIDGAFEEVAKVLEKCKLREVMLLMGWCATSFDRVVGDIELSEFVDYLDRCRESELADAVTPPLGMPIPTVGDRDDLA